MSSENQRASYAERVQAAKELAAYILGFMFVVPSACFGVIVVLRGAVALGIEVDKPIDSWFELVTACIIIMSSLLLFMCIGSFFCLLFLSLFLNKDEIEHITIRSRSWPLSRFERWLFGKLFRAT